MFFGAPRLGSHMNWLLNARSELLMFGVVTCVTVMAFGSKLTTAFAESTLVEAPLIQISTTYGRPSVGTGTSRSMVMPSASGTPLRKKMPAVPAWELGGLALAPDGTAPGV